MHKSVLACQSEQRAVAGFTRIKDLCAMLLQMSFEELTAEENRADARRKFRNLLEVAVAQQQQQVHQATRAAHQAHCGAAGPTAADCHRSAA